MPKLKTHKGAKKRFRVTKNRHVKRKKVGTSHLNSHMSGKRIRRLRGTTVSKPCDEKRLLTLLNE